MQHPAPRASRAPGQLEMNRLARPERGRDDAPSRAMRGEGRWLGRRLLAAAVLALASAAALLLAPPTPANPDEVRAGAPRAVGAAAGSTRVLSADGHVIDVIDGFDARPGEAAAGQGPGSTWDPALRARLRAEVAAWADLHGVDLARAGLRVHTTLDSRVQADAAAVLRRIGSSAATLLWLDTEDGAVRAWSVQPGPTPAPVSVRLVGAPAVPAPMALEDITGAYAALVSQGQRVSPRLLDRVEDAQGRLLHRPSAGRTPLVAASQAAGLLELLRPVVDQGVGQALRTRHGLRLALAGKSGTLRGDDAWFIALRPGLALAAWVDPGARSPGDDVERPVASAVDVVGGMLAASLRHGRLDLRAPWPGGTVPDLPLGLPPDAVSTAPDSTMIRP